MHRLTWPLILVGLIVVSMAFAQEVITRGHYSIKKAKQTKTVVTRVDMGAVKTNHLAKYRVQRDTKDKSGEEQMVLYDGGSKKKIEMRIRLFPSVQDTENGVLNLLNSQSVIFNNGSPAGHALGDNVWYFTTKETGATTIIFTRHNVVVSVFAQDANSAETLAERLDADILAGKNGMEVKEGQ